MTPHYESPTGFLPCNEQLSIAFIPIWTPQGIPSPSPSGQCQLSCWATKTHSFTETDGLRAHGFQKKLGISDTHLWGKANTKLWGFLSCLVPSGLTCSVGDSDWLAAGRAVSTASYSIHSDGVFNTRLDASDGGSRHSARHCELLYWAAST